jgi:hypothetical protein
MGTTGQRRRRRRRGGSRMDWDRDRVGDGVRDGSWGQCWPFICILSVTVTDARARGTQLVSKAPQPISTCTPGLPVPVQYRSWIVLSTPRGDMDRDRAAPHLPSCQTREGSRDRDRRRDRGGGRFNRPSVCAVLSAVW